MENDGGVNLEGFDDEATNDDCVKNGNVGVVWVHNSNTR